MNRTDRVLALLDGDLTAAEVIALGVTIQDADDATALARLDLELTRAGRPTTLRSVVSDFLRGLAD